jgi:uncharacterized protein (DUF58 family)
MLVVGRILGLVDLFIAGAGLLATVAACLVYVHGVRASVSARRRILPARVHAGGSSRVELTLINGSARRTPVLSVRDPFDGGSRWARFLVAPLAPGEQARAAYRLPTERRGVFSLGPLWVRRADPFGLTARATAAVAPTFLTVYPAIDHITPLPTGRGEDPLAGAFHPHALAGPGEDFYALRPYVRGDDLRRVHWLSTARTDELMIRQDEMPWQGRATVLVDSRAAVAPPPVLEAMLSAAASIVAAGQRRQSLLRLITTGGYDSGLGGGHHHVDAILEHLAGLRAGSGDFLRVLATMRRSTNGGGLAIITTGLAAADELRSISSLRSRFGTIAVVIFERSAWLGGTSPPERPVPVGTHIIRVGRTDAFASAWAAAFPTAERTPAGARR